MKFEILNRWTGAVQFTAEIDCADNAPRSLKVGLAVRWGLKNGADMRDADMRGANMRGADMSGADMSGANMIGADMIGADMRGANMRGADMSGADMSDADMRDADMIGADWIPKITNIHSAVFNAASGPDALNMGAWHDGDYCGATHCRAGWVVVLAGPAGRAMEGLIGTSAAAALIYQASDPALERIPDFYASDAAAMADMRRLADAETQSA